MNINVSLYLFKASLRGAGDVAICKILVPYQNSSLYVLIKGSLQLKLLKN